MTDEGSGTCRDAPTTVQEMWEAFRKENAELRSNIKDNLILIEDLTSENEQPDDLPDMVLRADKSDASVVFIMSFLIHCTQFYFVEMLMIDDVYKSFTDIENLVQDNLIVWGNDSNPYNATDEINILDAFHKGDIALTDEGWRISLRNILAGLALTLSFQLADLSNIFFVFKYDWYNKEHWFLGTLALFGQIFMAFWVAFACTQSIITSSLDTSDCVAASIENFFILEIDDKLLLVMWAALKSKGTCQFCVSVYMHIRG